MGAVVVVERGVGDVLVEHAGLGELYAQEHLLAEGLGGGEDDAHLLDVLRGVVVVQRVHAGTLEGEPQGTQLAQAYAVAGLQLLDGVAAEEVDGEGLLPSSRSS